MAKRLLISFGALLAISLLGFRIFGLFMAYEPEPSKREAEALTHVYDLEEFGPVEGSLLYTPENWGFFNDYTIAIVEQQLGEGKAYADQYVLIKAGERLTENEKGELGKRLAGRNADVRSKHKTQVYQQGNKISEAWYYKTIFTSGNERYLSFIPMGADDGQGFNFSREGYTYFKDF